VYGQVLDAIKKTLLGDAALPWVREVDVEVRKFQLWYFLLFDWRGQAEKVGTWFGHLAL
jgi:hypothetical protein